MIFENYDSGGDMNSLLLVIGWFGIVLLLHWIAEILQLSYRVTIFLWALLNIVPFLSFVYIYDASIPISLGAGVIIFFSYMMGKAGFEELEYKRIQMNKKEDPE